MKTAKIHNIKTKAFERELVKWWLELENWPEKYKSLYPSFVEFASVSRTPFDEIEEKGSVTIYPYFCFNCGLSPEFRLGIIHKHHIIPLSSIDVPLISSKKKRIERLKNKEINHFSNIHMLCKLCHDRVPNSQNQDDYWNWMMKDVTYLFVHNDIFNDGVREIFSK